MSSGQALGLTWMAPNRANDTLDELTSTRLVFAERGRSLALASPWRLPEPV